MAAALSHSAKSTAIGGAFDIASAVTLTQSPAGQSNTTADAATRVDEADFPPLAESLERFEACTRALRDGREAEARGIMAEFKRPALRASARRDLAVWMMQRDRKPEAVELLKQAMADGALVRDVRPRMELMVTVSIALARAGASDLSDEAAGRAIYLFPEAGLSIADRRERLLRMIDARAQAGDFSGAWHMAERNRNLVGQVTAGERITGALVLRVQEIAAEGHFDRAREVVESVDAWMPRVAGYCALAKALREADQPELSQRDFARALVLASRLPDLRDRFVATRLVAHYRARAGDPLMWIDYHTILGLIAQLDGNVRIVRELETTVEGFMLAGMFDKSHRLIEVADDPFIKGLLVTEFAARRVDRLQLLDALVLLRQLDRVREDVQGEARRDLLIERETAQRLRIVRMRYTDDRVSEGRAEAETAASLIAQISEPTKADALLADLVQALAEARDFAYATQYAEKIEDAVARRDVLGAVRRVETADQIREKATNVAPVSRSEAQR